MWLLLADELGAFFVDLEDAEPSMLSTSALGDAGNITVDLSSSPPLILESPGLCGFIGYCPVSLNFTAAELTASGSTSNVHCSGRIHVVTTHTCPIVASTFVGYSRATVCLRHGYNFSKVRITEATRRLGANLGPSRDGSVVKSKQASHCLN